MTEDEQIAAIKERWNDPSFGGATHRFLMDDPMAARADVLFLLQAYDRLKTERAWRPISELNDSGCVLLWSKNYPHSYCGYTLGDGGYNLFIEDIIVYPDVNQEMMPTHWQPLPPTPIEESETPSTYYYPGWPPPIAESEGA